MDLARPPDSGDHRGGDLVHRNDLQEEGKHSDVEKEIDSKLKDQSWAKVAQDKKRLKKYEVEISSKDGVHMVEIPDEVLDNTTPLWEDFIVGKFLDLAPHVAKVHMVLNKIWKYGDPSAKIEVYEVNGKTMRFKVSSLKAREKVLRRGMWNVAGVPMIVSKWSPETEGEDQKEEAMPMWVHLEKVSLHMFSWEGLSFITSTVGIPVKPHPETLACTNLKEAKIFVNVDVSKPLPKEITFSKEGKQFTVSFYYPWLPARCKICDKWGHSDAVCGAKKKSKKSEAGIESPKPKSQEGKEDSLREDKQEYVEKDDSNVNKEDELVIGESGVKSRDEGGSSGWSLVSPAKVGRSLDLSVSKVDEVVISASKFSILSTEVIEDGEILEVEEKDLAAEFIEDTEVEELDIAEKDEVEAINQQVVEEQKVGLRRGRKAKDPDANPGKSSRPRRKH